MPKRNIILPPIHNTRSPEQWRIISQHVDFEDKTVLDLGCGYGDIIKQVWRDGARFAIGLEANFDIVVAVNDQVIDGDVGILCSDVNLAASMPNAYSIFSNADIIICFSVLPYLTDPAATLHWIYKHSTQALIECQLSGDGPGFDWLKSPQDMRRWLDSVGWQSVERIGETVVKDRGAKRGIWLCQ